jgi:hypothetical protein
MVHAVDAMDAMDTTALVNSLKRLSDGCDDPQGGTR